MPEKKATDGQPGPCRKYTPAFQAECVHQVVAGARQSDVARAQGISPACQLTFQEGQLRQAFSNLSKG